MNKAFTKEEDGGGPERLPDLLISPHPNHVTPGGHAALKARQSALQAEVERLRGHGDFLDDLHPLAVAERDLRYVEARLATAIEVSAPAGVPGHVGFGAWVQVVDEDDREHVYRIVGEDEARPEDGLIAHVSPLARALLEARCGDVVEWMRPAGMVELEVLDIWYKGAGK